MWAGESELPSVDEVYCCEDCKNADDPFTHLRSYAMILTQSKRLQVTFTQDEQWFNNSLVRDVIRQLSEVGAARRQKVSLPC